HARPTSCLCSLLLPPPPPPSPPLFPYTTLFRSHLLPHRKRHLHEQRDRVDARVVDENVDLTAAIRTHPFDHLGDLPLVGDVDTQDRKSTRLNSSHQIISYAVFCLKKKMNTEHTI